MNHTPEENEALAGVGPQFVLHSYRDMLRAPAAVWLVKGLLPDKGVGVLYGPSGSGKTFLVMDLALSIGRGEDWAGLKVPLPRAVVYVALEAGAGIGKRLKARHVHEGEPQTTRDPALRVLVAPFDLTKPDNVKALGDVIEQQCGSGVLVIIDTLNRAAPGVDENSSQGIGLVVQGAQDLAAQVDGLVLLIHHTGKDASKGMRGSSALFAALDVAVEVVADGGQRYFRVAKNKDGDSGQQRAFSLQSVEVGLDDDGDPITSCVVKWEQGSGRAFGEPAGKHQAPVLEALKKALEQSTQQHEGVPMLPIAAAVIFATGALKARHCPRAGDRAREALKSLLEGGFIQQHMGIAGSLYTLV